MRMTALGKIIIKDLGDRIKELEAENARLRQQLDAANAQLDFLIEEMNKTPHGALVLYVQQTTFHRGVNSNFSTCSIMECS
ncbi:hypothetical protein FUV59_07005 [Escherichia coli]|nr:hypothetical protein [Escherichia coli]